jgi:hypothetical protein
MTVLKSLTAFIAALFFSGGVIAQDTPIKEYSSDNRLMSNVVTVEVLENGMVVHAWEWNDTAKALDPKYGAAPEDGGYMPDGLIAQDVQAKYPDAVIEDENGYLTIDLPVLADQDELIAQMVMGGDANIVATDHWSGLRHRPGETVGRLLAIYKSVPWHLRNGNGCHDLARNSLRRKSTFGPSGDLKYFEFDYNTNRKKKMPTINFVTNLKGCKRSAKLINNLMPCCDRKYQDSGKCEARCDKVWDYYDHPSNWQGSNMEGKDRLNAWIYRATWKDYLKEIRYIQLAGSTCYYYQAGSSSGRAGHYNWLYVK